MRRWRQQVCQPRLIPRRQSIPHLGRRAPLNFPGTSSFCDVVMAHRASWGTVVEKFVRLACSFLFFLFFKVVFSLSSFGLSSFLSSFPSLFFISPLPSYLPSLISFFPLPSRPLSLALFSSAGASLLPRPLPSSLFRSLRRTCSRLLLSLATRTHPHSEALQCARERGECRPVCLDF